MPAKTFYMLNTQAHAPSWNGALQDSGSAPGGANTAFGWTVAKTAVTTPYWKARIGATAVATVAAASSTISGASSPTVGTGAGATTAGDSFIAGWPLTGTFDAGNWSFTFAVRCTTAGAAGRINFRVWAGTNANGTGARSLCTIQNGATVTLAATATTYNSTATWAAPSITLNNEFLFIQVEWQETTAGTANQSNVVFRQNECRFTTANYTPINTTLLDAYTPTIERTTYVGSVGQKFTAVNAVNVTSLGVRVSTGDTGPLTVCLTDTTNNTIITQASCPITGLNIGQFSFASATPPVTLVAGRVYVLGIQTVSADQWADEAIVTLLSPNFSTPISAYADNLTPTGPYANSLAGQTYYGLDLIWGPASPIGTGDLDPTNAVVSGVGVSSSTGTADIDARASVLTGVGTSSSTGTGDIDAGVAALSGSGTVVTQTNGTGDIDSGSAILSGAGVSSSVGTSTLVVSQSGIAGVGVSLSTFTGSLVCGSAGIAGVGSSSSVGSGILVAGSVVLAGSGSVGFVPIDSTGVLNAGGSTLTGSGTVSWPLITGTGAFGANTPLPNFLLHGESFTDSAGGHTVSPGNSTISSTQKKFGASSISISTSGGVYLDGAADLSIGSSDNFNIDFWVYPTNTSSVHPMCAWYNGAIDNLDICIRGGGCLQVFDHGGLVIVGSTPFTLNGWNHVALTRSGGSLRGFLNGTQQGSANTGNVSTFPSSGNSPRFGQGVVGGTQQFAGYHDEIRFIKGVAVWTSNFTPPSAPYDLGSPALVAGIGSSGSDAVGTLTVGSAALAGSGSVIVIVDSTGILNAGSSIVSGVGTSSSNSTGILTSGPVVVAGVGVSASRGTGILVAGASLLTGTSSSIAVGTGALIATTAGLTGAGVSVSVGTSVLVAGASTLSGSIATRWDAQGALTSQSSVVSGSGTARSIGTGSLVAGASTIVGTSGAVVIQATGNLVAGAVVLTSVVTVSSRGTGTLAVSPSVLSGNATATHYGTGALQAGISVVSGSTFSGVTSTGDLDAASSVVAGTVTAEWRTTGILQASASLLTGTVTATWYTTGTLQAGVSKLIGSSTVAWYSIGSLQAGASLLTGTATANWYTTGILQAGASTLIGSGTVVASNVGHLVSGASTVTGVGSDTWYVTGDLVVDRAILSGVGAAGSVFAFGDLIAAGSTLSGNGGTAPATIDYPRTIVVPDTSSTILLDTSSRIVVVGVTPVASSEISSPRIVTTGNIGRTVVVDNDSRKVVVTATTNVVSIGSSSRTVIVDDTSRTIATGNGGRTVVVNGQKRVA